MRSGLEHDVIAVEQASVDDHPVAGGPADRAGLRGGTKQESFLGESIVAGGDVVLAIDGRPVTGADDLVRIVTNHLQPGDTARVLILRGGRRRTLSIRLISRPAR